MITQPLLGEGQFGNSLGSHDFQGNAKKKRKCINQSHTIGQVRHRELHLKCCCHGEKGSGDTVPEGMCVLMPCS